MEKINLKEVDNVIKLKKGTFNLNLNFSTSSKKYKHEMGKSISQV